MEKTLISALMVVALTFAGGCNRGGDEPTTSANTSTPAAATSDGPCSLVSEAEMATVLGMPVTRQEQPTAKRCIYYTENPVVYVDLEMDRQRAAESWQGVRAGNEAISAAEESVSGIGDQAFFGQGIGCTC